MYKLVLCLLCRFGQAAEDFVVADVRFNLCHYVSGGLGVAFEIVEH